LDNLLVLLVIGIAGAAAICIPLLGLAIMRHSDRIALDHYGKYRGRAPAKSFVCPDCLARSYAPSHVADRWCAKCQKSFPKTSEAARDKKRWDMAPAPRWFEDTDKGTS